MEGEGDNTFKPDGNVPLTIDSNPRKDRHIAQRNLAKFDITMSGSKQIKWQNFIIAQAGAGPNNLVLQHGLPMDTFRFYVAVPKGTYARYIAKGGKVSGFEVVEDKARDAPTKPFPEAVILRQTRNVKTGDTQIQVAAHDKELFLGLSLGIEWDPSTRPPMRLGDVAVIHTMRDGAIAGGFTVQLAPAKRRPAIAKR